jgi:VWFA-related protein
MRPYLIFSALVASLSSAQEPPRQVFRSGIDLVTVDAIVLDRQGKPVTDLTAPDFIVTAGKQQRKVKSAEFVAISTARPAASAATAVDADPVASVTSNVGLPESRSFLIVVDIDQINVGDGRVAMRAMSDFVSSLGQNDLAGVVAFPYGRPRVDLSRDRAPLRQAMGLIVGASQQRHDAMSVGEAASIEMGDKSVLSDWIARGACENCAQGTCAGLHPDCSLGPIRLADKVMQEQRVHSRRLFDTLTKLAEAMRPLRGLKTIVLVSEGMVRDRNVTDDLRRFAEAAAASRVTLYSLVLDIPQTEAADGNVKPPNRRLDANIKTNGMADAAHAAGGDVFMISGTPDNALKRIDGELAGYYLLSFESDPGDTSDKRKTIEVKVRRPNLTVRARTDFSVPMAVAPKKPATPVDLRARMGELLRWPVPVSDVAVDLVTFASPAPPDTPQRRVIIAAELPAGVKAAATGFEIADDNGKVISDSFEPNPSLAGGATYLAAVPLSPGRYQLKFGIVTTDDRRGSIQHSLWIRATPPGPLRLGDIVTGIEDADGFKPVARVPVGAQRLAVRVEIQATEAAAFEGASVLLDLVRRGEPTPFTSATMPFENTASPLKRVATAALTIGRLPTGDYVVWCTLQGGTSSERVARLISKR